MPLKPEQQAKFNLVCNRIAGGMSLRKACKPKGAPHHDTIRVWMRDDETGDLSAQYARADEDRADFHADELIDIADKAKTSDEVAAARLQIDTRKWISSKLKARKYGDKQEVAVTGKIQMVYSAEDVDL